MPDYAAFRRNPRVKNEVNCWKPKVVSATMVISSRAPLGKVQRLSRKRVGRENGRSPSLLMVKTDGDDIVHPFWKQEDYV